MLMSRVVYLVLSHTQPHQVARLLRQLRPKDSNAHIVLHHDETASHLDPDLLRGIGNIHRIPSRPLTWGDFSHVAAILRGMRWVRNHLPFDWLVLLSGQDYPIRPVSEIESFLSATEFDGFVKGSPVGAGPEADREGIRRYFYRYHRVPLARRPSVDEEGRMAKTVRRAREAQPLISVKTAPSGLFLGVRRLRTPFSADFQCYRGSTWFTISSRCVEAVDRFIRANPSYLRHYRRTRSAAESFIITILLNDPGLNLSPDHLRYIRFRDGEPNPDILTRKDLKELRSSGKHFARKFDVSVDPKILDVLDKGVLAGKPLRVRSTGATAGSGPVSGSPRQAAPE
jgi:hypothetical protein